MASTWKVIYTPAPIHECAYPEPVSNYVLGTIIECECGRKKIREDYRMHKIWSPYYGR